MKDGKGWWGVFISVFLVLNGVQLGPLTGFWMLRGNIGLPRSSSPKRASRGPSGSGENPPTSTLPSPSPSPPPCRPQNALASLIPPLPQPLVAKRAYAEYDRLLERYTLTDVAHTSTMESTEASTHGHEHAHGHGHEQPFIHSSYRSLISLSLISLLTQFNFH